MYLVLVLSMLVTTTTAMTSEDVTGNYFTSPNYPGAYPAFLNHHYYLSVPSDQIIKLQINTIALEPTFDYLQVYDGHTQTAYLLATLHSVSAATNVIYSTGSQLLVVMVSDSSFQLSGFAANFTALDREQVEQEKVFSSSNYPQQSSIGDYQTWPHIVPAGKKIQLDLNVLGISFGDIVYVYDGSTQDAPKLATIEVRQPTNYTFISSSNAMLVEFQSSSTASQGFTGTFTIIESCTGELDLVEDCPVQSQACLSLEISDVKLFASDVERVEIICVANGVNHTETINAVGAGEYMLPSGGATCQYVDVTVYWLANATQEFTLESPDAATCSQGPCHVVWCPADRG